jgi:hypothetical protein
MIVEKFKIKLFNLINWVLALVKDFWTLRPQNQFHKTLGLKILLVKTLMGFFLKWW